ncbi:hypothetical protein [Xylophilus sp.]|uniref:hypothetical protein n=1 Tax=Xylophilus sp. TaxID=2653893 RepID=UPI002D7F655F|nr:hypothetical protein [Xylophilus sp.]
MRIVVGTLLVGAFCGPRRRMQKSCRHETDFRTGPANVLLDDSRLEIELRRPRERQAASGRVAHSSVGQI